MLSKKLLVCIICTLGFSQDHFEKWVNANLSQSDSSILEIKLSHWFVTPYDTSESHGRIVVNKDKKFRFEMGYKTIVSDGIVWKTYDKRSNRLITQWPDSTFENTILVWFDKEKLLNVKRENITSEWEYQLSFSNGIPNAEVHFSKQNDELMWIDIPGKEYTQRLFGISTGSFNGNSDIFNLEIPGAFEIDLRE